MNLNKFIWGMTIALFGIMGATLAYLVGDVYVGWALGGNTSAMQRGWHGPLLAILTVGIAVVMARLGSWMADRYIIPALRGLSRLSAADRVLGIVGGLFGLLVGVLVTIPLFLSLPENTLLVMPIALCVLGVSSTVGMALMVSMRSEMLRVFPQLDNIDDEAQPGSTPKLLDTNVIIDGRMADLCKTGFIEGTIYVPFFVLEEVQYIADSADSMRRARGRRGLDMLNTMRELNVSTVVNGKTEMAPLVRVLNEVPPSVEKIDAVDSKLIGLAKEMHAAIVTNDFNLNRVAELHGVQVLNINELAQALKPVVLPGEEMNLTIVKEGKEPGQGVGYLEDGTMVVVGDGNKHVGETCKVTISSVYQTLAGKMIFAEMKGMKGTGDDLFHDGGSRSEGGGRNEGGGRHDDLNNRPGGGMRRKSKSER